MHCLAVCKSGAVSQFFGPVDIADVISKPRAVPSSTEQPGSIALKATLNVCMSVIATYVCMYVRMYVCLYVCLYVLYIHTYIPKATIPTLANIS